MSLPNFQNFKVFVEDLKAFLEKKIKKRSAYNTPRPLCKMDLKDDFVKCLNTGTCRYKYMSLTI